MTFILTRQALNAIFKVGLTKPPRRTFWSQLFTFHGRSSRANYWLSLLFLAGVYSIILFFTLLAFSRVDDPLDIGPIGTVVLLLNWGVLLFTYVLAAIRRLHDRDRSGHWVWLFAVVPIMLNIADRFLDLQGNSALRLTLTVPAVAMAIWGIVEMGFVRGTVGANRFGQDPLSQAHENLAAH